MQWLITPASIPFFDFYNVINGLLPSSHATTKPKCWEQCVWLREALTTSIWTLRMMPSRNDWGSRSHTHYRIYTIFPIRDSSTYVILFATFVLKVSQWGPRKSKLWIKFCPGWFKQCNWATYKIKERKQNKIYVKSSTQQTKQTPANFKSNWEASVGKLKVETNNQKIIVERLFSTFFYKIR